MAISVELIILVVVLTAAFFLLAISLGIKAQKRKPTTGQEGIVGESGTALTTLNPHGKIKVHGEIWIAESEEGIIKKGESVLVTAITGLKLKVKKLI
jgi:membrane-bound serine protease (ClpP class)